jgi:hypothetical protein
VNPFTNTINSISFTIYKDGVLFNTITQTINFTKTYYGTVPTGTISSFSDSQTYYATTCSTFLVDNRFLEYNTQYDIYASVIQSNTNSSGQVSIYGNYACDSTSNFKYNSSNTTYSSNFSFSYSNGTNTNAIVNGANYCNQQYSNTLCCGTINNDIANITTLNNTTLNSIVANIDILAATNANLTTSNINTLNATNANLTTSNINTLNATNTNLTNLALSNGIDWSTSLHGSMTQMAHLNNINVSQGGTIKMYTALHTGLFLLVVNDGSNTDYNMQYILMVYFSQNAAHLVQIFNNPGNKWAYGLITTQPSISFWNSGYSASYTDFYLYGVRLF